MNMRTMSRSPANSASATTTSAPSPTETAGRPSHLDKLTQAVLRAARELTDEATLSDATCAVLSEGLDNERLVELMVAIGCYNSTVRILQSLKVDLEPEYRHYLDEFPLPPA